MTTPDYDAIKARLDAGNRDMAPDVAALLAENEALRQEAAEYDPILTRQGDLLTGVANALHGPPPELTTWSHHDLPELAAAIRAERDDLRRTVIAVRSLLDRPTKIMRADLRAALNEGDK